MLTLPDFADLPKSLEPSILSAARALFANNFVYLQGPPGFGKLAIARRLGTLLPPMRIDEIVDLNTIYASLKLQLFPENQSPYVPRPFRAPHYTISCQAMTGKAERTVRLYNETTKAIEATPIPARPGEFKLASYGILLLDELEDFHFSVLEAIDSRAAPTRPVWIVATNSNPSKDPARDLARREKYLDVFRRHGYKTAIVEVPAFSTASVAEPRCVPSVELQGLL